MTGHGTTGVGPTGHGRSRRVVALVPNLPGVAPGQRFRVEAWARHLEDAGWQFELCPFEDARLHDVIYRQGHQVEKARRLLSCYAAQLGRVLHLPACDVLLVHREAAMIGPAVLERLAARHRVPLVYDLDDPTFVPYRSPTSGWFSALKFPGKTRTLFRLAHHVIAVNGLIGDYATRYNPRVTVIPNFVDVDRYRPAAIDGTNGAPARPCTILWSGSHTTAANLATIVPALQRVQAHGDVVLRVVCDGTVSLPGVVADVRPFSAESQVADLQGCQIGLLPLTDLSWNRWKSFFKAVQYMAVGLPVVARRMGANAEVVDDGVNGFLVETQDEWYRRIRMLVEDPDLRERMGRAARSTAVESYSADVQVPRVAAVLEDAIASRSRG